MFLHDCVPIEKNEPNFKVNLVIIIYCYPYTIFSCEYFRFYPQEDA